MNSKGQTLVLFVILLPVILGISFYFIDVSIINYQENRLNNIGTTILEYVTKDRDNIDKIESLVNKNDEDIEFYYDSNDYDITLSLVKYIEGYFGGMVGINKYKITASNSMNWGE